jgi:hypothetical protein
MKALVSRIARIGIVGLILGIVPQLGVTGDGEATAPRAPVERVARPMAGPGAGGPVGVTHPLPVPGDLEASVLVLRSAAEHPRTVVHLSPAVPHAVNEGIIVLRPGIEGMAKRIGGPIWPPEAAAGQAPVPKGDWVYIWLVKESAGPGR